jgi:hypothetical protein
MAIVTNQQIPTDHVEDTLDPPIGELDQYNRSLTEGAPIPAAPAGVERVSFTHKGSHPSSQSSRTPGATPGQRSWRDKFQKCVECWRGLPASEAEIPPCSGPTTKGHRPAIPWYPRSKGTVYHDWMKECLEYYKQNPDGRFGKCADLAACTALEPLALVSALEQIECGTSINVSVSSIEPGCPPYSWFLHGEGTLSATDGPSAIYQAPATNPSCATAPTISVTDACGQVAALSLSVNCYSGQEEAFVHWYYVLFEELPNCGPSCGYENGPLFGWILYGDVFACDGTLLRTGVATNIRTPDPAPPQSTGLTLCGMAAKDIYSFVPTGWHEVIALLSQGDNCGCEDPNSQGCGTYMFNAISNSMYPLGARGTCLPGNSEVWDLRTPAMIAQGCCPAHPDTGSPI